MWLMFGSPLELGDLHHGVGAPRDSELKRKGGKECKNVSDQKETRPKMCYEIQHEEMARTEGDDEHAMTEVCA